MASVIALACSLLLLFRPASTAPQLPGENRSTPCRYMPGDAGWPSADAWRGLNASVGGRLIATVPLAAPCHEPTYDAQQCAAIKGNWTFPPIHFPPLQEKTCNPFQPVNTPCTLGELVEYTINASSADDIAAGIKFAREKNIRLVVKNTGVDFLGKSTGKGALGIWTHNLNAIEPQLNYRGPNTGDVVASYTGPALKMGAGVQTHAAFAAAHALGYRVVGGYGPNVGIAGGYTLGGGHGPLTSTHGLAADSVLEWDVVLADGRRVVASPAAHADLFWALNGHGSGAFGVVVSVTVKMFADGPTAGARLVINAPATVAGHDDADAYWATADVVHSHLAPVVDAGAVLMSVFTNRTAIVFVTAPGQSAARVRALLQPTLAHLVQHNVSHALSATDEASFYAAYDRYHGPLPYGSSALAELVTNRIMPRSVFVQPSPSSSAPPSLPSNSSSAVPPGVAALTRLFRAIAADPRMIAVNIALKAPAPPPSAAAGFGRGSSVHPAWRSALSIAIIHPLWDWSSEPAAAARNNAALQAQLTDVIDPALAAMAPAAAGGGVYASEANIGMRNEERDAFGPPPLLARLRAVKRRYDPADLFWAFGAVGSEAWAPDADGRLCRAGGGN